MKTNRSKLPPSVTLALLVLVLSTSGALCADPGYAGAKQASLHTATAARSADSVAADIHAAVMRVEADDGAYAASLPEHLLSLGTALQQAQKHDQAIAVFKRGIHLTRVNSGLYSAEQIPLIKGEIASHIASGQFDQADRRQFYLHQVEQRNLESGEQRAQALFQQARWQQNAYEMAVGQRQPQRLLSMWDLYHLALTDIVTVEGETSPKLLPILYGMLRAQYLISSFIPGSQPSNSGSYGGYNSQQLPNRFAAYRSQSYTKGSAVIRSIYDIEYARTGDQGPATVATLVMLGDWFWWHDERERASEVYRDALGELDGLDDAQIQIERIFAEPVELPNVQGLRYLYPAVATREGKILLEFTVNHRGKVSNLVRLDESDVNQATVNRLMRKLRKTKFRPRLENGEPVITDKVVKAYDIL